MSPSFRTLKPGLALRMAARSFRREPATAWAAATTLALGIAAATSIFAVLHGFSRPLPVPEGRRIVRIEPVDRRGGGSLPTGADALSGWAEGSPALEAVAAFRTATPVVRPQNRPPFRPQAGILSPEAFPLLAVAPALGRLPSASAPGEPLEVAVGAELFRIQLDGDRSWLGRPVQVDGRPAVLVGVMPEGFGFPLNGDFWWVEDGLGRAATDAAGTSAHGSPTLVARLAPAASPEGAAAQITQRYLRYREGADPASLAGGDRGVSGASHDPGGQADPTVRVLGFTAKRGEGGENLALLSLLGLVLLLVLVSCANVTNLLLTRSIERARLLTVHAALGAGPGQVTLQILGEAFLLSLVGGLLGLMGGWGASAFIESTLAANWGYHWMEVAIDPAVVVFTAALVGLVTLVAGATPALRARRLDLSGAMKARVAGEGGAGWASALLLNTQVAFSATALVIAILIAIGLVRLGGQGADLPIDEVLIAGVTLDSVRYPSAVERAALRDRLAERLAETGAGSWALSTGVPGFRGEPVRLEIPGRETAGSSASPVLFGVTSGFFDAFGVEPLRGRLLEPGDMGPTEPVAVVSAAFAKHYFSGADPVGENIRVTGGASAEAWVRIVGVARDLMGEAVPRLWLYTPIGQRDPTSFFVLLRASDRDPRSLAPALREAVQSVDPELVLDPSMMGPPSYTLAEVLDYAGRFYDTTGLLSLIGGLGAVWVSILGVYGVLSLDIRRRTREMGVRMAIGASRARMVGRVLRQGIARVLPGLGVGLLLAWVVSPFFGLFFGAGRARDPWVFAAAITFYLAATLAAAGGPALRAARSDPARVLRDE